MKAGNKDLEVYTDGGLDSQGTVLVLWGKSPIMWKSGRQGAPALSTAESELAEGIDGMVMGDSVDVLVLELSNDTYAKVIKKDRVVETISGEVQILQTLEPRRSRLQD